ncbi:MAG: HpcH/HpaI aldolase/citrate lyase family protein [Candidatus Bathyarchaeia archaeon]
MKLRRSMLFVPGNNMRFIEKAIGLKVDGIIFDLEDAVPLADKDAARGTVRKALAEIDWGQKERIVRINPPTSELGLMDVKEIVKAKPDALLLPKINSVTDVLFAGDLVRQTENSIGLDRKVELIATLESAQGVINVDAIAKSDPRLTALAFGPADYTADLGGEITADMTELLYPRARIAVAAAAASIDAVDQPYLDVKDDAGLERDARRGRALGFKGKLLIHPNQIDTVHRVYSPSVNEVEWATKVIEAYTQAVKERRGAVTVEGRMVDTAVVEKAKRILAINERIKASGG